jgi:hypothetical protein
MNNFHTTPEGREALSRAHSSEMVCALRLTNGLFALYNHAKRLQRIVTPEEMVTILEAWPPFEPLRAPSRPKVDLSELGIL